MSAQGEFDFTEPPKADPKPATKEVLERIKKLLRLGQSSQPHEAALAMRRAFELAQKHGVDVAALDLDEQTERLAHEYFRCGERLSYLRQGVLGMMHFFRVELCVCGPRVVFVGRETDVAIAGYVYDFLVWAGNAGLRDYCAAEKAERRKVTTRKKRGFTQGFIYGIAKQLGEAREQQAPLDCSRLAVVVAEKAKRERYMAGLVGRTEKKKIDQTRANPTALMAGFRKGQETQINQPLAAGAGRRLALS